LLLPEPDGPARPRRRPRGPRRVQLTDDYTPDFRLWWRMAGGAWGDFLWPYMGFMGMFGGVLGVMWFLGGFTAAATSGLSLLGIIPAAVAVAQLNAALPVGPAIKAVLGREYELMDFILGLQRIVPILLYTAMNAAFAAVAYGPAVGMVAYLMVRAGGPKPFFDALSPALVVAAGLYALVAVPLAYVAVFARFGFALCLVFDRGMGFFESMGTSWRMTRGHYGSMFLLLLTQVGLLVVGAIPCGVATGLTVSYAFLLRAAAYVHATTPKGVVAYAAPGREPDEDDELPLGG
ncbi:MAG: hypothetical protein ACRC33_11030, partial [Gemmataceae bacterium]